MLKECMIFGEAMTEGTVHSLAYDHFFARNINENVSVFNVHTQSQTYIILIVG